MLLLWTPEVCGGFIVIKPGCHRGEVAFKDVFDLKATAIEQLETDGVSNQEDGVLKEVVQLFKGENIELLRVGSGQQVRLRNVFDLASSSRLMSSSNGTVSLETLPWTGKVYPF